MHGIILFDGECNFCDQSVQFIIKRDPHAYFKFASLQSKIGQQLCKEHEIHSDINSLVLIEGNQSYVKSTAVLRICRNLKGAWKALALLQVLPSPIRNFGYDIFAKNRYKWFGTKNTCELPPPEIRKRFL